LYVTAISFRRRPTQPNTTRTFGLNYRAADVPEDFNQYLMKILEFDGIGGCVSFEARALDLTSWRGFLVKTDGRKGRNV
jgi:hypothetical protein